MAGYHHDPHAQMAPMGYGQPPPQQHYDQSQYQQQQYQPNQQQMHPHPGVQHPPANHHDPHMGGQQYYHERGDGKSAGIEEAQARKTQEIQALQFEITQLENAQDPNHAAAQLADRMNEQPDPFQLDSDWSMKTGGTGGCCIIQ